MIRNPKLILTCSCLCPALYEFGELFFAFAHGEWIQIMRLKFSLHFNLAMTHTLSKVVVGLLHSISCLFGGLVGWFVVVVRALCLSLHFYCHIIPAKCTRIQNQVLFIKAFVYNQSRRVKLLFCFYFLL